MTARRGTTPWMPLQVESLELRSNPSTTYIATDLISNQAGVAPITDPTLLNAWGISLNPNGAIWVSANGANLSEVYGNNNGAFSQPFKVNVPGGAPTGQVFAGIAGQFMVSGVDANGNAISAPAAFIFASESGMITGWNPGVFPSTPAAGTTLSTDAITAVTAPDGAIYKGLAMGQVGGANFLYAADFHNGKIDVFDSGFNKVTLGQNGFETFTDPNLPAGFAPFNVANIGGKIYVSYAKQDAAAEDDVAGRGNGFIDVFDTNGHFDQRLVSRGDLNSPWAMVQASAHFGQFSNDLLVGNFGDGMIHAFDPTTGKELGTLGDGHHHAIHIDGLWGLSFGNAKTAEGGVDTLFYSAGPNDEANGLFGRITANAQGTNPVTAVLDGGDLKITGSRDSDRVEVELNRHGSQIVVEAGGDTIGKFATADVATIHFNGFAGNDVFVVSHEITATVVADGGAGNDILKGGSGNNILLGNTGNDAITGGSARDMLLGGMGHDFLFGMGNDDILIGGTTDYDTDPASLTSILDVWNSAVSYNDRVDAIRNGANGVPQLDSTTVHDDGDRDVLFGGPGLDWFFATAQDAIHGRSPAEQVN